MDGYVFSSGYISVAIHLPILAAKDLQSRHLICMDCRLDIRKPLAIFARLHVGNGPNTAKNNIQFPQNCERNILKFDLSTVKTTKRRIKIIWVDRIFEAPAMNKITLRDIVLSRHPRAQM